MYRRYYPETAISKENNLMTFELFFFPFFNLFSIVNYLLNECTVFGISFRVLFFSFPSSGVLREEEGLVELE